MLLRSAVKLALIFLVSISGLFAQSLSISGGNGQVVLEQFLSQPLVVQARDASGQPAPNVNVTWTITQGQGTIEGNPATTTDANGLASIIFLSTSVAPGMSLLPVTITATAGSSSVNFYLTTVLSRLPGGGDAAPPLDQLITPAPGTTITGPAGGTLPGAVQVLVTAQSGSQAGQPVANVGVRILPNAAGQPSASCNAPGGIALTNAQGLASCDLVLGPQTGTSQLTVEVGEAQLLPMFNLQVTPGVACTYTIAPVSQSFAATANAGIASITTQPACGWTATASNPWIIPAQTSGTGSGSLAYTVTANPGGARAGTLTISGQVLTISQAGAGGPAPLTITTPPSLPVAQVGVAYSTQAMASGGSGSYTWSLSGSLPAGLTFSAGRISGVPTTAGSSNFSITVTDLNLGSMQSQFFTLAVLPGGAGLTITNTAFPNGVVGQPYQQTLTSTPGCSTPFSPVPVFRLASGSLPPGLAITQPADRVYAISGTPTTGGAYPFTLSVTDACGAQVTAPFTITVTNGNGPVLTANPASLQFGPGLASTQNVNLTSSTALNYSATVTTATGGNWLAITNSTGTTPGSLSVSAVNTGQLAPGVYSGAVSITSAASNNPLLIPVTLTVAAPATLTVSPASLAASLPNSGATISQQAIVVASSGSPIQFTASATTASGGPWLYVAQTQGTTPTAVLAIINAGGLAAGTYAGAVTITSANGTQTIPVVLTVTVPSMLIVSPGALSFSSMVGVSTLQQTLSVTGYPAFLPYTVAASTTSGGNWLTAQALNPNTNPSLVNVSANPNGLAAGTYTGLVALQPSDPTIAVIYVPVTLNVSPSAPAITAITNAASFAPGAVAPGEFITIFGSAAGPLIGVRFPGLNAQGMIDTTLAGTQVFFDEIPAPIIYSSAGQVSAIVPFGIAGRASTSVVVQYLGAASTPIPLRVVDAIPGIFMLDASGQGAILNQNGSVNSAQNPAAAGSIVSIYATGAGQTTPPEVEGQIVNTTPFPKPVLPVTASIGGADAPVSYAGAAPGLPTGLLQVNARVPNVPSMGKPLSVTITVGTQQSPPVNIWVTP